MDKKLAEIADKLNLDVKAYVIGQDTLKAGIQYVFTLPEGSLELNKDGTNARFYYKVYDKNGREVPLRTCPVKDTSELNDRVYGKLFSEQMEDLYAQCYPNGSTKVKTLEFYYDCICNKDAKETFVGKTVRCYVVPQSFDKNGETIHWTLLKFGDLPVKETVEEKSVDEIAKLAE